MLLKSIPEKRPRILERTQVPNVDLINDDLNEKSMNRDPEEDPITEEHIKNLKTILSLRNILRSSRRSYH